MPKTVRDLRTRDCPRQGARDREDGHEGRLPERLHPSAKRACSDPASRCREMCVPAMEGDHGRLRYHVPKVSPARSAARRPGVPLARRDVDRTDVDYSPSLHRQDLPVCRQLERRSQPFAWVKIADEILAKAVRKPRAISESGH